MLRYSQYANSFSDFLKISFSLLEQSTVRNPELTKLKEDTSKFIGLVDATTGMAYDIKSRNYNALVLDSSILLTALIGNDWAFKDSFARYGTFMANITEAKNSDEVNQAIESAVLPAGSSSIKRESAVNISLNAYLGVFYGREYMPALHDNKSASSAGLLAPVGVALSLGNIKSKKCAAEHNLGGKSFTLFLSVIDVGALASYRFDEEQTNIASDIKLENIVSPGLFLYYGLGKCPISVGGGVQFSPQLRGISDSAEANISETKQLSIRYGVSIVVDIPLFNLYTKSPNID